MGDITLRKINFGYLQATRLRTRRNSHYRRRYKVFGTVNLCEAVDAGAHEREPIQRQNGLKCRIAQFGAVQVCIITHLQNCFKFRIYIPQEPLLPFGE
jgi:hypothetical protein